ncbi:MAG: hypothetical protein IMZ61_10630 [Planctomycetes bacterium]|nr:hypothetical protein [Planctomycetota bacterium]
MDLRVQGANAKEYWLDLEMIGMGNKDEIMPAPFGKRRMMETPNIKA